MRILRIIEIIFKKIHYYAIIMTMKNQTSKSIVQEEWLNIEKFKCWLRKNKNFFVQFAINLLLGIYRKSIDTQKPKNI